VGHHLVERKRLVGGVPSAGCPEKVHEPSELCQHLLKTSRCPSYAGHYLSLDIIPTIASWTVFQELVLHIPDGNVSAPVQLILSPTTTQTLPCAAGETAILRSLAVYVSVQQLSARQ
jgi:hypothetical protein